MKKLVPVLLGVLLSLVLVARGGITMTMDHMGKMPCDTGVCQAQEPMMDCISHCLVAGLVHPIDAVAPTLLFLLAAMTVLSLFEVRKNTNGLFGSRGSPLYIGRMLVHERVATDVLRN